MKFLITCLLISFGVQATPSLSGEAELGRYLFNDVRLSLLGNRSCAICHSPESGWTNRFSRTPDIDGKLMALNTSSLLNVVDYQFFSQRSSENSTFEDAITRPLFSHSPAEMGMTPALLIERLEQAENIYKPLFISAYQTSQITVQRVTSALRAYLATIRSVDTLFHRFKNADKSAFNDEQRKGWELFNSERLSCTQCHGGELLNKPSQSIKSAYINVGLYGFIDNDYFYQQGNDVNGILKNVKDKKEFRVPSLINVTETAPWGHDGSFWSLQSVLDSYARGGRMILYGPNKGDGAQNPYKHHLIKGFTLSNEEKHAILSFFDTLKTPSPSTYTNIRSPFCQLVIIKDEQDDCIPPFRYILNE